LIGLLLNPEDPINMTEDPINMVIGAFIGLFSAVLIFLVAYTFYTPFDDWLMSFVRLNIRPDSPKLRILLVGLSRTGKTSIIRRILTEDMPRQEISTNRFIVYEETKRLGLKNPQRHIVSIADYKGQKLSQITVGPPVEFFGTRKYRLVNVVIILVDLFPELLNQESKPLKDDKLVQLYESDAEDRIADRVAEHREYVTKYIIELIFSVAYSKDNLFALRLLVNKADLLRDAVRCGYLSRVDEGSMEEYVKRLYTPISDEIKSACQANNVDDFSVHLVSAKTGENIPLVFSDISETYHRRSQQ
jgi:GTPase SAR1 family protein